MMKWLWTPRGMEERKTKFLQSYIDIDIVSPHVCTRFFFMHLSVKKIHVVGQMMIIIGTLQYVWDKMRNFHEILLKIIRHVIFYF